MNDEFQLVEELELESPHPIIRDAQKKLKNVPFEDWFYTRERKSARILYNEDFKTRIMVEPLLNALFNEQ